MSGMLVIMFVAVSFPSISLECSFLCSCVKQSKISLNLSATCGWLVFDTLFLKSSSADIGVALRCLFLLVTVHLSCSPCHCGHQIHVLLLYHASMVCHLPTALLHLILQVEREYFCIFIFISFWLSINKHNKVILIINPGCLLHLGSMPLVDLLKRDALQLGNQGLISVDYTCNKVI